MKQYAKILKEILSDGSIKPPAREGLHSTLSIFGKSIVIKNNEFPILMGKKVLSKNVISELIWFLKGKTNVNFLHKYNNHIWDDDAYRYYRELGGGLDFEEWMSMVSQAHTACHNISEPADITEDYEYGDCGRIYGFQWREQGRYNVEYYDNLGTNRKHVDQIKQLVEGLIHNPFSRYHIVDAWNWQDYNEHHQALPACHNFFQCNVREYGCRGRYLDIFVYQRSCDMFLGVPYNLLSYGILHRILCRVTGYHLGTFTWTGGDCHIYKNQIDAVNEYLKRVDNKLPANITQCSIAINGGIDMDNPIDVINNIEVEDITLINYNPLSYIKAPLNTGVNKYRKDEDS